VIGRFSEISANILAPKLAKKLSSSLTRRAQIAALVLGILASVTAAEAYKSSDVMTDVGEDVRLFSLSGRVVNQQQKALSGVPVVLFESAGKLSMETKTGANGEFKFQHKSCGELCLDVLPDRGLKLAEATLENLPGEETRKLIVELKTGFLVTGRITHDGKGIKGLIVRVKPVGAKDKRTKVHGGGTTETGRGGTFNMILTEGQKNLLVINEKYPEYSRHVEKSFGVYDDTHLGRIELP